MVKDKRLMLLSKNCVKNHFLFQCPTYFIVKQ